MTLRIVALAALLCVAAGCASTARRVVLREMEQASVRATQPLAKVLVVTIDGDAARRRTWDEAFASRLGASGVQATTRGALLGDAEMDAGAVTVDGSALLAAARRAGAGCSCSRPATFRSRPGAAPSAGWTRVPIPIRAPTSTRRPRP